MKIILASASPRRREILTQLGIKFEIITSDADETCDFTAGDAVCRELAYRKARSVQQMLQAQGKWDEDTLIIGCDTVVVCNNQILGKPQNQADAKRMLRMLSGSTHTVSSGLCLLYGKQSRLAAAHTDVTFDVMSENDIAYYVSTGEPMDKAGAYAVQGIAARWIEGLCGCYYNVVGLPVHLLNTMAKDLEIDLYK